MMLMMISTMMTSMPTMLKLEANTNLSRWSYHYDARTIVNMRFVAMLLSWCSEQVRAT